MNDYETLSAAGQVRRLRRLAGEALRAYPLRVRRLWPVHHGHNTTFGVEATAADGDTGRYALRASMPGWRLPEHMAAELSYLNLLRQNTDLTVPRPVATRDGSFLVRVEAPGIPGERYCMLTGWIDGQFLRRRLSATGMRRVGRLTAALHNFSQAHAADLAGLQRPSVQWERRAGLDGDMDRMMKQAFSRAGALLDQSTRSLFQRARERLEPDMRSVGQGEDQFGLIHADLHQGNILHYQGDVRAIDFDDCGWGHYLYDLAVTQWYFRNRSNAITLNGAHLAGYREARELTPEAEALLPIFLSARTLAMACYIASRSDHPRFRRWAPEFVRQCAAELERFFD
jgi:Ser/Thr protein kinase RdoA (MazF antagonist)